MSESKPTASNGKFVKTLAWAVPIILSALWFYVQLLVWKQEGHDHMLTVANFVVTVLLWASLAWAAYYTYKRSSVGNNLFTPLQFEAFRLAKKLRILLGDVSHGQSAEQFHRMRLEYEQEFSPRVKELMFAFAREQRGEDSTLRRHVQFIDNGNDILNVINALIRLAHIQDGIDCTLRYPS